MTILVTGGCGFIGSNFILDWFATSREPLVNLDKLTYAGNASNLAGLAGEGAYHFVFGAIEDFDLVGRLLSDHDVRAVINFAAESHVDRSIAGPEQFVLTNVLGTLRLLEAAKAHWLKLEGARRALFRFVHVSTDEVYGSLEPGDASFTEDSPFHPNSPYAASKASSDHFARAYSRTYGLPVITTNCSNNYGPYQFPEKLIPLVVHNCLAGKSLPIYGDGRQVRDWLFVSDHCDAIRRALDQGRPGETYNVGGHSERENLEVVRSICTILDELRPRPDGNTYLNQIEFIKDRPGHDRRYSVDTTKVQHALGWRPQESFETGLRKTVAWYLANSTWVKNVTTGAYRDWIEKQYG